MECVWAIYNPMTKLYAARKGKWRAKPYFYNRLNDARFKVHQQQRRFDGIELHICRFRLSYQDKEVFKETDMLKKNALIFYKAMTHQNEDDIKEFHLTLVQSSSGEELTEDNADTFSFRFLDKDDIETFVIATVSPDKILHRMADEGESVFLKNEGTKEENKLPGSI